MTKDLLSREGYVIRVSSYKEADAMVNAIDKDGTFAFLARGIKKMTSKNYASCLPLCYSKFSLTPSLSNSLSLKEGMPISSLPDKDNLEYMGSVSLIYEIAGKLIQDEDGAKDYPWLDEAIKALKNGFSPLTSCLLLLCHILVNMGYGLNVDSCVICNKKKDIIGISYEEGGFMCRDEEGDNSLIPLSPRLLNIIRYSFRCGTKDFQRVSFAKDECLLLLNQLGQYVDDVIGVSLKSLLILAKC